MYRSGKVTRSSDDQPGAPLPQPPSELFGDLFRQVQMQRVFADGKTFVDLRPLRPPAKIMEDFAKRQPVDRGALAEFVTENFAPEEVSKPFQAEKAPLQSAGSVRLHIRRMWDELVRTDAPERSGSKLILTGRYVVPGGRFRELYYWDSYFTMLGLAADGRDSLLESMIDQFVLLLERFGLIPNGARSYYLSRSQPPVFYLMCLLSRENDRQTRLRRLTAMVKEHSYWMTPDETAQCSTATRRIVHVGDATVLNRYWDDLPLPRDESFREDTMLAAESQNPDVFRELRAACESGWDFSSRWMDDDITLASLRTTAFLPVDLNSLLFGLEKTIAQWSQALGFHDQAQRFEQFARRRRAAICKLMWSDDVSCFVDFDWKRKRASPRITAAALFPLFVGVATREQARRTAVTVFSELVAPGGLSTTNFRTGEQWDHPNGWAPMQWIAVQAFASYGMHDRAQDIAVRWLSLIDRVFQQTGQLHEKYDVVAMEPGGGGEYVPQAGFGWTNGVTAAFVDRFRPDQ